MNLHARITIKLPFTEILQKSLFANPKLKNEIKGYKGSVEKINSQGDPVKRHAK